MASRFGGEGRHKSGEVTLAALNVTFNDTVTSVNSADITVNKNVEGQLDFNLLATGTPTRIQFYIETKTESGSYDRIQTGFWQNLMFEDTAVATTTGIDMSIPFTVPPSMVFRFAVEATGTDTTNSFEIGNALAIMRT